MIDFRGCDYDADSEYLRERQEMQRIMDAPMHRGLDEQGRRFCYAIVIGGILGLAMWLGIILLGIHLVHWMERL